MNALDDVKAAMAKIAVAWNEAAAVIEKHAAEPAAAEPVADDLVAKIANLAGFFSPEAKLAISAIVDVFVAYERSRLAHEAAAAADPTPPSSPSSPTVAAPAPSTSSSAPSPSSPAEPTSSSPAGVTEPPLGDVVQAAA